MPPLHDLSPASAPAGADEPAHGVHVLDPQARLHMVDGLLVISRPDQPDLRLRLPEVESVSIHGRASVTTPCLHALLDSGIDVIWRTAGGRLLGQTSPAVGRSSAVR